MASSTPAMAALGGGGRRSRPSAPRFCCYKQRHAPRRWRAAARAWEPRAGVSRHVNAPRAPQSRVPATLSAKAVHFWALELGPPACYYTRICDASGSRGRVMHAGRHRGACSAARWGVPYARAPAFGTVRGATTRGVSTTGRSAAHTVAARSVHAVHHTWRRGGESRARAAAAQGQQRRARSGAHACTTRPRRLRPGSCMWRCWPCRAQGTRVR